MEQLTDEYIITKAQNGHADSIGLLYERYKRNLFSFFYGNLGNKAMAEDLVQNTFIRVIKYSNNYSGKGSFKSWLFQIARNQMIDEIKKMKKHKAQDIDEKVDVITDYATADASIIKEERSQLLKNALSKLSEEKRNLLTLVKIENKKFREVAEIMNMKESTVKSKVFRAIKELQELYRPTLNMQ